MLCSLGPCLFLPPFGVHGDGQGRVIAIHLILLPRVLVLRGSLMCSPDLKHPQDDHKHHEVDANNNHHGDRIQDDCQGRKKDKQGCREVTKIEASHLSLAILGWHTPHDPQRLESAMNSFACSQTCWVTVAVGRQSFPHVRWGVGTVFPCSQPGGTGISA